ncbi:MAG: bifunctional metallophosphatase/5'-nucleotidase [Oscillospiraceae bacterium]|nr:bifunctional metallophosphatase/5'-nucleotidase [Oscillospiraceae bacterium]
MKRNPLKRTAALLLLAVLITGLVPAAMSSPAPGTEISILFTHDMHAHFDPERYLAEDGSIAERGGFARLKTAIDRVRERYPDSFLLDAGDFSMGTLYQTIFLEEAPDLRLMGRLGYDAATLGNHEFDYRTQGLTDMLDAALASGERLPALVSANIDWDRTLADEALAGPARALKAAMERYGVSDYILIEKGGVKAAVFGLLGKQADAYAPESGLYFKDPIETAKAVVAQIKADTDADLILCVSHGRLSSNPANSEDERLAAAVPDIDVIVSGHSHTYLRQPITVGHTLVVAGGEHTYELGHLRIVRDGDRCRVSGYELIPIDQSLPMDGEIEEAVMEFRELVDRYYLSRFGYHFDQELAYTGFGFTPIERFSSVQGEDTLGNLIADSYIAAVKNAEGGGYRTVDAAVVPSGVVRGSFTEGVITVAEAFAVSSLGIGPDRIPGYPLVSMYLTGKELKTVAEIDISVSTLMGAARLYISGLTYTYNPNRLLLNRVTETRLTDRDGNTSEIDDNALYRVIGGLYSCQMMGEVESQSFGLLSVTPKDANGDPITDFEQHIVYDGGAELKEWVALAQYLESFEPVGGLPRIPEYYNRLQGRKVEETGRSLAALLKKPNKIFFLLLGVIVLVLALFIVPTCLIIRKIRRKKRVRAAA